VPLLTGSSSDQLNKGRTYTFTPFARASQFALAQLRMSRLVSDKPKVAVVFENHRVRHLDIQRPARTGDRRRRRDRVVRPYSAGSPMPRRLINKVKSSSGVFRRSCRVRNREPPDMRFDRDGRRFPADFRPNDRKDVSREQRSP